MCSTHTCNNSLITHRSITHSTWLAACSKELSLSSPPADPLWPERTTRDGASRVAHPTPGQCAGELPQSPNLNGHPGILASVNNVLRHQCVALNVILRRLVCAHIVRLGSRRPAPRAGMLRAVSRMPMTRLDWQPLHRPKRFHAGSLQGRSCSYTRAKCGPLKHAVWLVCTTAAPAQGPKSSMAGPTASPHQC